MHSPWLSWAYQYGVGGVLFVAGILLALRTGAVKPSLWTDRRLLTALIAGVIVAAAAHAAWIAVATR